jgi:hypothetical protein
METSSIDTIIENTETLTTVQSVSNIETQTVINGISPTTILPIPNPNVNIEIVPNPDIISDQITHVTVWGSNYMDKAHALSDMLIGGIGLKKQKNYP